MNIFIKKIFFIIIRIFLPITLIIFFLYYANLPDMSFTELSWIYIPIIILLQVLAYCLRSVFCITFTKKGYRSFFGFFALTGLYNFISSVLPFGSGHLSFPVLANKFYHISLKDSFKLLFTYNILRVFFLFLLLIASSFYSNFNLVYYISKYKSYTILFLLISFSSVIYLIKKYYYLLSSVPNSPVWGFNHFYKFYSLVSYLLISLLVIMVNIVLQYCCYLFLNQGINLSSTAFIVSVDNLSNLVPIHGFARAGSYEAINSLLLIGLNYSSYEAVKISLAVHFIHLFVQGALAFVCWISVLFFGNYLNDHEILKENLK